MDTISQLPRFVEVLRTLPDNFHTADPLPEALRLSQAGTLTTYYAPFDYVNPRAKIVIAGITPGRVQAMEALAVARRRLIAGADTASAAEAAKVAASFAGPMRSNLIAMLDALGVHRKLGLNSCGELWAGAAPLVHFTSVLRYPVFDKGKNFSGGGIPTSSYLQEQVKAWFVEECRRIKGALVVPLGSAAMDGCQIAISQGALDASHVLGGLPHPSGANAERIAYFLGRKPKSALSMRTKADVIDEGRQSALRIVADWQP